MRRALLLASMLCLCLPSQAQKKHKEEPATPESERSAQNAHSFMEMFSKLERDWMLAVQKRDHGALDGLLAPEFIERRSTDPAHGVPRADWMQDALNNYKLDSFSVRDMVIRAFLGNAVVSFVQSQKATVAGAERSGDFFIVDLWVVNHGNWQVATRFVSPIANR